MGDWRVNHRLEGPPTSEPCFIGPQPDNVLGTGVPSVALLDLRWTTCGFAVSDGVENSGRRAFECLVASDGEFRAVCILFWDSTWSASNLGRTICFDHRNATTRTHTTNNKVRSWS